LAVIEERKKIYIKSKRSIFIWVWRYQSGNQNP